MGYVGYNEAKKKSNARWAAKQDVFQIRFKEGQRDRVKAVIEGTGESLNQFILEAIEMRLEEEGK